MEIKVSTNQDIEIIEEDDGTRTVRIIDIPGRRLSTFRPGDTFLMDGHEWIVLDTHFKTDYGCGYGVGVISKDFYIIMPFGISTDFAVSNVRQYLDDVVLYPIRFDIRGEIIPTIANPYSLNGQNEYMCSSCFIRSLTYDEARKYNQFLVNEDLECEWWTCTPWSTNNRGSNYDMVTIDHSGIISKANCKRKKMRRSSVLCIRTEYNCTFNNIKYIFHCE